VVWAPDGLLLASGSHETTIRLWDAETGQEVNVLEGHTGAVLSVSFSADGRFLASKSRDNTVRLWRSDTWEAAGQLDEPGSTRWLSALTFHPHAPVLATLDEGLWVRGSGYEGRAIRIWDLDLGALLGTAPSSQTVYYTNAKVVLVGDSGVGKSGLGPEVWTYLLSERVVTRKHSCKSWVCYDTTLAIHSLGPLYQHTYA